MSNEGFDWLVLLVIFLALLVIPAAIYEACERQEWRDFLKRAKAKARWRQLMTGEE